MHLTCIEEYTTSQLQTLVKYLKSRLCCQLQMFFPSSQHTALPSQEDVTVVTLMALGGYVQALPCSSANLVFNKTKQS